MLCGCSNQAAFLSQLSAIQPDVCVTAAYGNILPQNFLDIPKHGTLNIHPSLLPKYRGASPVQRALQVVNLMHCATQAWIVLAMNSTLSICMAANQRPSTAKRTKSPDTPWPAC